MPIPAISGAGSVIADRQATLFSAVEASDHAALPRLRDEMNVLVEALYGQPYVSWQARMKEILFRCGRISTNVVRGPLQPTPESDWTRMQALLQSVGLNEGTLYQAQGADDRRRGKQSDRARVP